MRPHDDRLRHVLLEEAERHAPDREAILARVNRRRGPDRGPISRLLRPAGPGARRFLAVLRPAAAALAVAGVLVAAIAGTNLASRPPQHEPAAPPAEPATPSAPGPGPSGPSGPPTPPPVRDRYLSAAGVLDPHSISSWSQSNLTLTTVEEITALDVTLRVARTPEVADTGHWSSIPAELITATVTSTDAEFVYHFTLNPGARLANGSYLFAAQYNHDTAPRPLAGDRYEATSTTATGTAHVTGGFTAQPG